MEVHIPIIPGRISYTDSGTKLEVAFRFPASSFGKPLPHDDADSWWQDSRTAFGCLPGISPRIALLILVQATIWIIPQPILTFPKRKPSQLDQTRSASLQLS